MKLQQKAKYLRDQIEEYTVDLTHLEALMDEYESCVRLVIIRHNEKVKYWRQVHKEEMEESEMQKNATNSKDNEKSSKASKSGEATDNSTDFMKTWTFYSSDIGESTYSSTSGEEQSNESSMSDSTEDRTYNIIFNEGAERSIIF